MSHYPGLGVKGAEPPCERSMNPFGANSGQELMMTHFSMIHANFSYPQNPQFMYSQNQQFNTTANSLKSPQFSSLKSSNTPVKDGEDVGKYECEFCGNKFRHKVRSIFFEGDLILPLFMFILGQYAETCEYHP